MKICKVKVLSEGKKGLLVSYLKEEDKHVYTFNNSYDVKYRYPLNKGIVKGLEMLGDYLRDLMGFKDGVEIEVTGVVSDASTNFIITYKVKTVCGLYCGGSSPRVTDSNDYDKFEEVIKVIESLYEHVEEYVEHGSSIEGIKQYTLKFSDLDMDEVDFDAMAEGDKRVLMKEALMKSGCIVIDKEDIEEHVELYP